MRSVLLDKEMIEQPPEDIVSEETKMIQGRIPCMSGLIEDYRKVLIRNLREYEIIPGFLSYHDKYPIYYVPAFKKQQCVELIKALCTNIEEPFSFPQSSQELRRFCITTYNTRNQQYIMKVYLALFRTFQASLFQSLDAIKMLYILLCRSDIVNSRIRYSDRWMVLYKLIKVNYSIYKPVEFKKFINTYRYLINSDDFNYPNLFSVPATGKPITRQDWIAYYNTIKIAIDMRATLIMQACAASPDNFHPVGGGFLVGHLIGQVKLGDLPG